MEEPRLIKKSKITDIAIQKQKKILMIAVFCVITLLMSSSYALLTNFDKTDNIVTISSGNLNMTISNPLGLINLNGKLPENNITGLINANPIALTFTNTGTMKIEKFDVKLIQDNSVNNVAVLDDQYIKYAFSTDDGLSYSIPSILTENDNIFYSGYNLEKDQSKTIYLKIWIDENAGNSAINKEYYGSIKVDLYQDYTLQDASDVIKSRLGTDGLIAINTNGDLATGNDEIREYRYSGENVNNYVEFNNELWRIVGIFDDKVKLVRNEMLPANNYLSQDYTNNLNETYQLKFSANSSSYYWNKTMLTGAAQYNDWTKAGLMYYLNDEGTTNGYLKTINNDYEELIDENTEYYLSNVNYNSTTKNVYVQERQTPVMCANTIIEYSHNNSCNIWDGNQASWIGKIGLLYASDYGYSTDSQYWTGTVNITLDNFGGNQKTKSWLTKELNSDVYFWFISPASYHNNTVVNYESTGKVYDRYVDVRYYEVLPSLTLKSNAKIVNPEALGTIANPYKFL